MKCTDCHEYVPNGLLGSPVHCAGGECRVEQFMVGHHLHHGAKQYPHLIPVNGGTGHLL